MLVLTLRTHDIMIFGEMNGKLPSENPSGNESRAEEENDEMRIPCSRERSRLKNHLLYNKTSSLLKKEIKDLKTGKPSIYIYNTLS